MMSAGRGNVLGCRLTGQAEQGKEIPPKVDTLNQEYKPTLIINLHQVFQQRFTWSVTSRIGSLENLRHRPSGGDRKIFKERVNFSEKATPRLNTMENKTTSRKRNEIKAGPRLPEALLHMSGHRRRQCTTSACHGWRFESNRPRLRLVSQQSDAIKDKPQQQEQQPAPTNGVVIARQAAADGMAKRKHMRQRHARIDTGNRGEARAASQRTSPRQLDNERSEA
uniref:Microtubule-associated protein n=1 Tax=Macrostomum lignano TaxID=282301 RepID=A0A1I8JQG4_9PLAT